MHERSLSNTRLSAGDSRCVHSQTTSARSPGDPIVSRDSKHIQPPRDARLCDGAVKSIRVLVLRHALLGSAQGDMRGAAAMRCAPIQTGDLLQTLRIEQRHRLVGGTEHAGHGGFWEFLPRNPVVVRPLSGRVPLAGKHTNEAPSPATLSHISPATMDGCRV